MTDQSDTTKLKQSSQVQGSKYEKVKFEWSKSGEWYKVSATVGGLTTNRLFRYEKDNPKSEEEQFREQALKVQQDVIDRFEFIYKAKRGELGAISFNG